MNTKRNIFLSMMLMLFIVSLSAQNLINVTITGKTFYNNFPANSLDPMHPREQPEIFKLILVNETAEFLSRDNFYGKFTASINGDMIIGSDDDDTLTPNFDLVGGEIKMISSTQIIVSPDVDNFDPCFDSNIDLSDILDENADLESNVMDTGKFPDGEYIFTFEIFNKQTGNSVSDEASFTIIVNSPNATNLIYPGSDSGRNVPAIMTSTPAFTWSSNQANFELSLYELEDSDTDLDDLDNPFFIAEDINSPFIYPARAPSLEEGNIYAWQVKTTIISPDGETDSESGFYLFTIGSDEEMSDVETQMLSTALEILGAASNQDIANLLTEGYTPTGSFIMNNEEYSVDQLLTILTQLQNQGLTLKSVVVE